MTVTRSGPTVGTVTVDYATAAGSATSGADYTDVSGTLTFAAGIASRTFTVPIINDTVFEARSRSLSCCAIHRGRPAGTVEHLHHHHPRQRSARGDPLQRQRLHGVESAGVATITVQRTAGSTASAVTIDYATVPGGTATPGADYLLTSGTLTFKAGEVSKTFTVPIVNDNVDEPSETVNLALSNPTGGATLGTPVTAVLTISDEDVPGAIGFSAGTYAVLESAGLALITVTRTGAAGAVTVGLHDGGRQRHRAGRLHRGLAHALVRRGRDDQDDRRSPSSRTGIREGNETILLVLSNPTGGATLGATRQAAS